MMGWFEIANLLGSGLLSAVMTIWAQKSQDRKDEREFLLKRATETRLSLKDAREANGGHKYEANQDKKVKREIIAFGKTIWKSYYDIVDTGVAVRSTGYHFTRRIIALMVIFSVIVLPKILPLFHSDVTVMIGYYENLSSWLPWVSDREVIKWIAYGAGDRIITISPFEYNIVLSVMALFFGNQFTKRS